MAAVTFQVLSGMEQGRTYHLTTPISIGREEENTLRLNDERVSRFHAKIQEEKGCIILADLESTNGTRVNGLPVQIRVLQVGDQVLLGKSLLLFGSPEQIEADAASRTEDSLDRPTRQQVASDAGLDSSGFQAANMYFPHGPPPIPQGLRPLQTAQLSDLLTYLHGQLLQVMEQAHQLGHEPEQREMALMWNDWQKLVQVDLSLAQYLRKLAEPQDE